MILGKNLRKGGVSGSFLVRWPKWVQIRTDTSEEGHSVLCTIGHDIRSCAVDYLLGHFDLVEMTLLLYAADT